MLDTDRLRRFLGVWPHPCAVVGGLAIVLRVQARLTRDIDVVLIAPEPRRALLPALRSAGYEVDEEGIDEWLDGGLVRAIVPGSAHGLDVIIADSPWLVEVARRARPVQVEGKPLPVATLEDLLLMKLEAGRPSDLDDALAIRESFAGQLDREYLASRGPALRVDAIAFLKGA